MTGPVTRSASRPATRGAGTGTRTIRLGTRGSALALVQAGIVERALRERGHDVVLITLVTEGDIRAPDTAWGEGAFVGALEQALSAGEIDAAVHSAKDVPTAVQPGLRIAAYLPREDPGDVLVRPAGSPLGGLDDLATGSRVGTDSPRRSAFLRAIRPDLGVRPLHGNVDTRLRRLDDGDADVLVLAAAGLRRLGREDRISARLDPARVPPAPGQGALAVQARDDVALLSVLAELDHPPTRSAVEAERALLAAAGGGCRAPLGALATVRGDHFELDAGFATADGSIAVFAHADDDAQRTSELVDRVLAGLAEEATRRALEAPRPRVISTRPADRWAAGALALVDRGFAPLNVPAIETAIVSDAGLGEAAAAIERFDWIVVTSATGVRALAGAARAAGGSLETLPGGLRWAAVGEATARALEREGIREVDLPSRQAADALAETLPVVTGARVLLALGDMAGDRLERRLAARGARVTQVTAYRTIEAPPSSLPALVAALAERPAAWIASSPSSVRGLLTLARAVDATTALRRVPLVAIGPTTAQAAADLGLRVAAIAPEPDPGSVADTVAALVGLEVP